MKTMHLPRLALTFALVLVCGRAALAADEPATRPSEPSAYQVAETRLLRAQLRKLQGELEEANAQIVALKAKLTAVGVPTEDSRPAAAPAGKARRIVFAIDYPYGFSGKAMHDQVRQAISELGSDQWFNVVCAAPNSAHAYSKVMVPANDRHRQKAATMLTARDSGYAYHDARAVLLSAQQFRPDVIFFFGPSFDERILPEVVSQNRGSGTRINTSTAFATSSDPKHLHTLWQLAHDTGGVCVDAKGNVIDEPVLPMQVAPTPAVKPATKPSVFRVNP